MIIMGEWQARERGLINAMLIDPAEPKGPECNYRAPLKGYAEHATSMVALSCVLTDQSHKRQKEPRKNAIFMSSMMHSEELVFICAGDFSAKKCQNNSKMYWTCAAFTM